MNKKVTNGTTIAETDYLTGFQTERARFANIITAQRSEAEQISNSAQYLKPNAGVWDLQFFPTAEGYVDAVKVGTNTVFTYVYNYTDHLGNVRLSYAYDINNASLKIMEENNYYPFELRHRNYNFSKTSINPPDLCATCPPVFVLSQDTNYKYKYQGQERQDEFGLNWDSFKWRNYDYTIGRFMSIDPLAEKYNTWAPYSFSGNRVVDARELEGLEPHILFGSLVDANNNFAQQYNGYSIRNDVEVATKFYKIESNGEIKYAYNTPVKGGKGISDPKDANDFPKGAVEVGFSHTHDKDENQNFIVLKKNELIDVKQENVKKIGLDKVRILAGSNFPSEEDEARVKEEKKNNPNFEGAFTVTPSGIIWNTGTEDSEHSVVPNSVNITPSDPNSKMRQNNINPDAEPEILPKQGTIDIKADKQ